MYGNDIPVGTGFTILTFHRATNVIALTVLYPTCRWASFAKVIQKLETTQNV